MLKRNTEKSLFGQNQMEYLGFWATWNRIVPINKNIEAILKTTPPKSKLQVRALIGLVKYYRGMWSSRSHLLQPLTLLMSDKEKVQMYRR